jgi:hypothetical protein
VIPFVAEFVDSLVECLREMWLEGLELLNWWLEIWNSQMTEEFESSNGRKDLGKNDWRSEGKDWRFESEGLRIWEEEGLKGLREKGGSSEEIFLAFGMNSLFLRMHLFIEQSKQISTVGWTITVIESKRWIKVAPKPGKAVGACGTRKGTGWISRRVADSFSRKWFAFRKSRKRRVVARGVYRQFVFILSLMIE